MRRRFLMGVLMIWLACSCSLPERAWTAPGTPHSLSFGQGVYINSNQIDKVSSLRMAAQRQIDWVALDFDWASTQPTPKQWNENESFSQSMKLAHCFGLEILVSVRNPPAWALTPRGPDADLTAVLVESLARRYPSLGALELFPGANTLAGWGVAPDAAAYSVVFKAAQERLDAQKLEVYLVAGGLLNISTVPGDVPDVDFLQKMYAAGARPAIVAMRLVNLAGQPLDAPSATSLRHYEEIRSIMVANGHAEGLLWITDFIPPAQAQPGSWLTQGFAMMKSQLYLGVVFYTPLTALVAADVVRMDAMCPSLVRK